MYLNIIKTKYDKPVPNIILNGKKLKPYPLKSRMRLGIHYSHFNCQSNKARKRNKGDINMKEEVKLSLFADDRILHLKNPKYSSKNS
jgi:hypothetical protein